MSKKSKKNKGTNNETTEMIEVIETVTPDTSSELNKLTESICSTKSTKRCCLLKKLLITILSVILVICVFLKIYAISFVNKLDLDRENVIISINDVSLNNSNIPIGEIYIEYYQNGDDYYLDYNVNGYQTGLYNISNQLQAFYAFGSQFGKYKLTDDNISNSIMVQDLEKIKDIFSVTPSLFYPQKISSNGIEENIYKIKNKDYIYFFYVDKKGYCNRFEVCDVSEEALEREIFRIRFIDAENEPVVFPEELSDGEFEEVSGEDFSDTSHTFMIGAIAASISEDYIQENYVMEEAIE